MNDNHEHAWAVEPDCFFIHRDKPYFIDGCQHDKDAYLGSFQYPDMDYDNDKCTIRYADVYVFSSGEAQKVCIRTGNEPWDYASVGTVLDLLTTQTCRLYQSAAALVDLKMKVRFERIAVKG